jgi:hypothetical protein
MNQTDYRGVYTHDAHQGRDTLMPRGCYVSDAAKPFVTVALPGTIEGQKSGATVRIGSPG